jgi:heat shock protein HslJ
MKKTTIITSIVVIILSIAGGVWYVFGRTATPITEEVVYKNIAYTIAGESVALINGKADVPVAPGSASHVITQYFGNEATGDLNGDGVPDIAFLLTQTTGGSGTFYYVVGAIKTSGGYVGTNATLIGDRIAPQTTEIKDGKLIVNYAVRATGEPMTTPPSIGKSLFLKLDTATNQFGEVVQNFEGEADPASMTLSMKTWTWVNTLYSDGKAISPKKTLAFTLTFKKDSTFSATTDCNNVGGEYATQNGSVTFSKMISTLMYCDGSQEADFNSMLQAVQSYHFTTKGELVFDLKMDSGTATFR